MANFSININKKISNVIIGEDVAKGDLLYLDSDNKWYKTTAGNKVKSTTELMMALSDGLEGEQIELLNYGYFEFDNSILIPGDKYYVSINNGKITNEVYDTDANDYVIRYVGTAFTNKTLLFNPDQTYISDNRTKINEVSILNGTGGIDFTTDESLYLDPVTKVLRANLTTTIDTFNYLSGVQEFTLTETPVRMLYVWVQGVGLVKKNIQYEIDGVSKKLTILDELEGGEVITACYHNVINESVTPFVTDVQVENKDLDVFKNESADPYVRMSEIPNLTAFFAQYRAVWSGGSQVFQMQSAVKFLFGVYVNGVKLDETQIDRNDEFGRFEILDPLGVGDIVKAVYQEDEI